jgi:hypothetical protein
VAQGLAREDADPLLDRGGVGQLLPVADMYTAWSVPGGTVESNTTMAICGFTAMFCEWRAPG